MICETCHGTRHVKTPKGGFRRCGCVLRSVVEDQLRRAGAPEGCVSDPDPERVYPAFAILWQRPADTVCSADWFVRCPPCDTRDRLGTTFLRKGVMAGKSIAWYKLSTIMDSRYDSDARRVVDAVLRSRRYAVVIEIDDVGEHKRLRSIFEDAVNERRRSGGPTMYLAAHSVWDLPGRYGPAAAEFFGSFVGAKRSGFGVRIISRRNDSKGRRA